MKKLVFLIILSSFFSNINAQNDKKISMNKLLEIKEKTGFPGLVTFVANLEYVVLDSSKENNGSIFYFTKELKLFGNTLACTTDASEIKIDMLTFVTYNKEDYFDLKAQLKKLGFTSSGIHKSNRPPITESQDFDKGKTTVATAARKDDDGMITYEFTFLKW